MRRLYRDGGLSFKCNSTYQYYELCKILLSESQFDAHIADSKDGIYNLSKKRVKEGMEALQAIVNNWDKRMTGDKEILKKGGSELQFDYWSPSASMVSSEFIASAREALNKVNQK